MNWRRWFPPYGWFFQAPPARVQAWNPELEDARLRTEELEQLHRAATRPPRPLEEA